ncbi:MAG: hypothetical protein R3B13_16715 [Polyangiaceae bacterium]
MVDASGEQHAYVRVAEYVSPGGAQAQRHTVGLLDSGRWVWEYADGHRVSDPNNLCSFLPLLEFERPAAVAILKVGLARLSVAVSALRAFPFDGVVVLALTGSPHWQAAAEMWLDAGYPPNDRIAELRPRHPMIRRWLEQRMDAIVGDTQ